MDCVLLGVIASSSSSYQFKEAWEVSGEQLGGPPGSRLITTKCVSCDFSDSGWNDHVNAFKMPGKHFRALVQEI